MKRTTMFAALLLAPLATLHDGKDMPAPRKASASNSPYHS